MNDALPEPLVPPEVNLRGYRWMKLDLVRLFSSDFFALASGDEFRAGVTLWGRAMDQIPAGTLPDDDRTLAALAGYGRDAKGWTKVREMAMRGWFAASDGRLHHPTVAETALDAWRERVRYRADKERLKRWRDAKKSVDGNGHETPVETVTETPVETRFKTQSETAVYSVDRDRDRDREVVPIEPSLRSGPIGRDAEKADAIEEIRAPTAGKVDGTELIRAPDKSDLLEIPTMLDRRPVAQHAGESVADAVWRCGVSLLAKSGRSETSIRSALGRLVRDHGEAAVFAGLRRCERDTPADPVAYLAGVLAGRGGRKSAIQNGLEKWLADQGGASAEAH